MGQSTNAAHLVRKLHVFTVALPAIGTAGLVKAAATVEAAVGAASGKYRGHPITQVRAFIAPPPTSTALVKMTSRKANLLDHDTHFPHKSRSLTQSSDFSPREGVRTQGKYMWEKGVAASRPRIVAAFDDAIGKAMVKVFGA